jgi:hypothetical protein
LGWPAQIVSAVAAFCAVVGVGAMPRSQRIRGNMLYSEVSLKDQNSQSRTWTNPGPT